jgi:hypothetical protein
MNNRVESWLPDWWRRNFLVWEFWFAVLLTVAIFIWGNSFGGNAIINDALSDNRSELYSLLASLFGSLFGFVIAATSIVLGVANRPQLHLLRQNQYKDQLWDVLFSTMKLLGLATVIAVLGLLIDTENTPHIWLSYLTFGAIISVALRLIRCVWILENVVRIVAKGIDEEEH